MSPHSLLLFVASAFGGLVIFLSGLMLDPGQRHQIANDGMEPTFSRGSSVELDTDVRPPGVHDIIVYSAPTRSAVHGDQAVGRIVATSGQLVEIVNGQVRLDGAALAEPYLSRTAVTMAVGHEPIPGCAEATSTACLVPEGMVFILGDNRSASYDSRKFGPVALDDIIGYVAV